MKYAIVTLGTEDCIRASMLKQPTITRMGAMYTTPMREELEMSMEEVFGEVIVLVYPRPGYRGWRTR